jgi:mannose/fructose-specific phosphotransferase system component IIA
VNLPLLVKAVALRRQPLEEVVAQLIESGRSAIFAVEPPAPAAVSPTGPDDGATTAVSNV